MRTSHEAMGFSFPRRTDWCVAGQCAALLAHRPSRHRSRRGQFCDPQQIVGGPRNERRHLRSCLPDESALPHPTHRLQPAEDFLHPLSFALTDAIALGVRGATIEPRRCATGYSGNVWPNVVLAQMGHECFDVIALVGRERLGVNAPAPRAREHRARGTVLGLGRIGHEDVHAQPVAVLHEHMPPIAQPRRLAAALPHEAGVRIGRTLMCGVRAILTLEVDHPGAVASVLRGLTITAFEALERRPRVDERSVDGEMIRGQESFPAGQAHHFIEEAPSNVGDHQALAQAAEVRLVQTRALKIHVEKPAKENVVVELFAKQPIRANRIQRDEQLPFEQAFGRNRRPTCARIQRIEIGRNGTQGPVGQFLHAPQRMVRRHARLGREVVEHRGLGIELAAHRCLNKSFGNGAMTTGSAVRSLSFASPC